jgi:quinohemoprotein ethanol dehydrogenase
MRRSLLLAIATALVAVTVVAVASASRTTAKVSWLPQTVTPAGANWLSGEGDISNSRFSTLSQINAGNVANLHVVWNAQWNPTNIAFSPEGQPICCANDLMVQTFIQGVVGVKPDTGETVWKYNGPESAQLTAQGQRLRNDNARTQSYSPGLNMVYSGQQDGSIVALNAKTGAPVWTTSVIGAGTYGDATQAESEPFTQYMDVPGTNGILISAPNGGESPFRGHLDAFDAKTGKLLWRTWNLPDPTQVPYILSWGNPAEAATGGAAVWSIPAVDPQLGTVFYGTGNPFPETGRSPGWSLWTETIMAVNWKTGALKWFFQATHHDNIDLDLPHPPMVLRVPIDGKTVPVLAEGSKGGFFYVLNAKNGGPVPHHKVVETPTFDPSGKGLALNAMAKTQPFPSGASFCMAVVDYSPEGLAKCNFPGNPLVDEYKNVATVNSPTQLTNPANGFKITGAPESAAFDYGAYLVYGGVGGGGTFGYPPSSYDPDTHTYYACLQNASNAHSNAGPNSTNLSNLGPGLITGITGFLSAIDLTTNTMRWQDASMANGTGACYSGTLATKGNIVFTWWKGRSDVEATLPNQGATQQGAASLLTPGAQLNAYDATTGKKLWVWGVPNDTAISPVVTYMYKGKQYLATYHGVAAPGFPGSTASGQRDQMTVFSL